MMLKLRLGALITIILAAAATRFLPHPPNLTSITALALFGGAYFSDKRFAFVVPLAALFLSDLFLGFYPHMELVYASFALVVCIGIWLQTRRTALGIVTATFASSCLFFLITNFGVWFFQSLYPKTLEGLMSCYIAALPFFQNALQGDLLFTAVLFGTFTLLEKGFPLLRDPKLLPVAITV
ncbi:MAG: DUF6580 family putative transport protein [Hyphomicrobium sp.]